VQKLEFNIEIAAESDPHALAEIADQIKAALADDAGVESPAAVPIMGSRGVVEIASVIAVALSVVVDIDKGLKAVEGMIARFQKLFAKSEKKSEQILAGLDASNIMISVDGVLVPLNKLTEDHLTWLRSQRG